MEILTGYTRLRQTAANPRLTPSSSASSNATKRSGGSAYPRNWIQRRGAPHESIYLYSPWLGPFMSSTTGGALDSRCPCPVSSSSPDLHDAPASALSSRASALNLATSLSGLVSARGPRPTIICPSSSSAFGSAPVERGYWSGDRRAALDNLKELGLEGHQALIVAHTGGHPHVHVIANRVNPENGNAAVLSQSKLKLSRWAEAYERTQGQIWCKERVVNNERRKRGQPVKDRVSQPSARFRREVTSPTGDT